ncbi:nicotinamide-nucleotide amidohydrolase family protein [Rhodococcus rhodnii]|uniref:Competence damage induced protein n=2 Tax=Rhodococcus rhodnii TaxID=38312 RepID=R7WSN4_9NOCA|nr:nicotinamide-nucleotide amidohydrolase family protein [Rhodococcus rhodnii]EOM77089.1 competence damage induced protein [Rhodococcus rhodnii LMG 5362]TXG90894.1 nicotinamide-nucleotide amidohydrolase family protein [Rhodococcus rhodnii]
MTDPLLGAVPAASDVVAALTRDGATVAAAESLTAGLLTATLASVPGASAVLRGGLVVYATDLKASLAGVEADALAADGPVAESAARALATGARERCGAHWGVGTTGVAGPDPQDGHPVGTVFVAVAGPDDVVVRRLALDGSRWQIRIGTVSCAVSMLLDRMLGGGAR